MVICFTIVYNIKFDLYPMGGANIINLLCYIEHISSCCFFEAGNSNRPSTRALRYRANSFFHVFSLICYDAWKQRTAIELIPFLCCVVYSFTPVTLNEVIITY